MASGQSDRFRAFARMADHIVGMDVKANDGPERFRPLRVNDGGSPAGASWAAHRGTDRLCFALWNTVLAV